MSGQTAQTRYGYGRLASLVLTLAALAGAAAEAQSAARNSSAPPPAERPAPSVARPNETVFWLGREAGLRRPTGEERTQFFAELDRSGCKNVLPVVTPVGYARRDGTVLPVGSQFATLQGDLDGDKRPEWVVGCYFPSQTESVPDPESAVSGLMNTGRGTDSTLQDDRARILVFKRSDEGQWRLHWRSPGLGFAFVTPEYNLREVRDGLDNIRHLRLPISLVDIDADGRMEIAYHCQSQSEVVGALPGILRFDGSRWVGVAPQADRFSIRDIDGDRKLEVITGSRYIGYGMGDDDVPRVWRWNGRQYQEASGEFPHYYAGLATTYSNYIRKMEGRGESFQRHIWERAFQKAASLAG